MHDFILLCLVFVFFPLSVSKRLGGFPFSFYTAEEIKKRWQEYTEELYLKSLNDPDNHGGVVTHLEPDILECEVKWALGSITMNKARQQTMEFQLSYFIS